MMMMTRKALWIFCALLPCWTPNIIVAFTPHFATTNRRVYTTTVSVRLGAEKKDETTDDAKPPPKQDYNDDNEGVAPLHVVFTEDTAAAESGAPKPEKKAAAAGTYLDDDSIAAAEVNDKKEANETSIAKKKEGNELPELLEAVMGAAMEGAKVMGEVGKGLFAEQDEKSKTSLEGQGKKDEATKELLEAFMGATVTVSKGLFQALRSTAAYSLTSSLPDNERKELLTRMQVNTTSKSLETDDSDREDLTLFQRNSVKENIAAAVARESQRNEKKWAREKEQILKQAEQAAEERVQSDLAVQQQRMEQEQRRLQEEAQAAKRQLEQEKKTLKEQQEQEAKAILDLKIAAQEADKLVEKEKEEMAAMEKALHEREQQALKDQEKVEELVKALETAQKRPDKLHGGYYTPKEYRALSDEEKEMVTALREAGLASTEEDPELPKKEEKRDDVHPILGPVISDLGYKRVHLVSTGKLGTIPIWKKQRIYRHNRTKAMATDKLKSLHLGLPGVICLHEEENGQLSIIDGQHRVGMMMLLREKLQNQMDDATSNSKVSNNSIDFDRVLVEVYPHQPDVSDSEHAEEIFTEINKAEPIKLVDMPGVATAKDRKVITEAVEQLQDKYLIMFSPSQRCRVPNLNVDNLRNNLFGANVLKQHNLTTTKKLLDWILKQNEALGEKYEKDPEAQSWVNPKAWKKASENRFYLGLESSWLYNKSGPHSG